ncbi:hypothetical protein FQR65_LT09306 [Abscondita terminalis]|nr:hypothetical protein FQR65_LT09306 [Abscondita terminalis]
MIKFMFVGLLTVIAVVYVVESENITDEFDGVDIDQILSSKRLVDNYLICFKTGQKCTRDGKKARELLPDVLQSKCSECNDVHVEKIQQILTWVVENKPDDFLELETIFDAEHKYREIYADELEKRNIVLPPLK